MNKDIKYLAFGILIGGGIAIAMLMLALLLPPPPAPAATAPALTTPSYPAWTISVPNYSSLTPGLMPATASPDLKLAATSSDPSATPTFPPDSILAGQITAILPDYGGDWNILIRADGTRDMVDINADRKNHVASIIKIPIAMLFFKTLEERGIPPEDYETFMSERGVGRTYMQLLTAMLVESEEEAAGTMKEIIADSKIDVPAILESWGTPDTDIGNRHSSPHDIATLYENLYYGNVIAPEGRDIILKLLSAYTENDNTRLGVLRPFLREGSEYYNKRGTVTKDRLIVGDSALISIDSNGERKVYVIVILSYNGEHPTTNIKLEKGIEAIAQLFWDFISPR